MPRNNYKDAGTAIDKELRRLLKFELNDKSFIKKWYFKKNDFGGNVINQGI
jgi:hypothetical protein